MSSDPRLVIPYVTEQSPRGERTMDIYSRLLSDRIIFLGTPVDDQVANVIMAQLLHLDSEDPEQDINLYINSPGGSVNAGMADLRHDAVHLGGRGDDGFGNGGEHGFVSYSRRGRRASVAPYRTPGYCSTSRSIQRGNLGGQVSDVEIHAREIVRTKRRMNELYAEMTGQPYEKIENDTDRDYMLGPEAAVEYGVIDQVVSRPGQAAS